MGLHTTTGLELALLDKPDDTCHLLSFEEDDVAPSGSSEELEGAVSPEHVTE